LETVLINSTSASSFIIGGKDDTKLLYFQLEEEIATLRSVLDAKVKEAGALKQKLGITPLVEFTDDFRHGIQVIRESETLVFVTFFQICLTKPACCLIIGVRWASD